MNRWSMRSSSSRGRRSNRSRGTNSSSRRRMSCRRMVLRGFRGVSSSSRRGLRVLWLQLLLQHRWQQCQLGL